ncbi:DNA methyltransferase [Butyricimonas faecihominis]|uniref:DNA methyltransferase n=1 Tax=Butyricimonas faecihominis TaxID=1472416 RepID=UPI0026DCC4FD|nr:DNA methyltransferase [Butyricimonas faecihominis]
METRYYNFLRGKINIAPESGFEVLPEDVSSVLKPHQRDSVIWAIRGGRRALFESFGLGKTIQQLEICRMITSKKGGKALIVCPLGVKQEFTEDARNLLGLNIKYIKTRQEAEQAEESILITNYERVRDGDIDPKYFKVTSLDEASVLRSFGSKTYQTFLEKFRGVEYKFVCTATPSPNKYKELIHYAGYLEIMDTGLALTRFFQRDSTKANNLTLYPHKEQEFWLWMSSWALFVTSPSDLGYDSTGYDLPEMNVIYHVVKVDNSTAGMDQDGQVKMFRDAALGLKDAAREKRDSMKDRISKMKEIIDSDPGSHYVIWHDLESERHEIKRVLPEVSEVYGSLDIDTREQRIIDFAQGKIKYLATKPSISGQGCNFQRHCHKAIFTGIGYEFNDFIQAIHRIYRFLQTEKVEIHVIYAESEGEILKTLQKKWKQHDYLVKQMTGIIKKNGLNTTSIYEKMQRSIGIERKEEKGELFTAINNDCVIEAMQMKDNSVDLIHTSIPFSNHYEYTPSYNDFGHNEDNDKFFEQMDYLTPELLRILKPGRVAAIHVKDRILFGNATGTGMPTVDPFHATCIFHYLKHGFQLMGMITVVTDVVRENNQTYRLGWSEQCKDGTKMGVGCPEYILLFRKLPSDTSKAYADTPVQKTKLEYSRARWQIDAHAFWKSSGNRLLTPEELSRMPVDKARLNFRQQDGNQVYDYHQHVKIAERMESVGKLPATFMAVDPVSNSVDVWDDVVRMRTLNTRQSQKRLVNHVCPLQLDIVERIINRYTNPGELVFDPFGGLMTVPYMAVKMGRKGMATELNADYFRDGVRYLREAETEVKTPTLFDLINNEMTR